MTEPAINSTPARQPLFAPGELEAWAADYIARNGTIDSHWPRKPFDFGPTVKLYGSPLDPPVVSRAWK
jgi:hypothetical protein